MAPIRPIPSQCRTQTPAGLAPFCAVQPGPDNFECVDTSDFSRLINAFRLQSSHALFETGAQRRTPVLSAGSSTFSANESGALLLVGLVGLGILAGGWAALAVAGLGILACSPSEKVGDPVDKDRDGFISKQYSGDDCNDSDKDVHPGATEICNGKDDNCDGNADEGLPKTLFCRDHDDDKYGDKNAWVWACTAPSGYVDNNGDCDDTEQTIHPGVTETCNNRDDNCDGNTDEGLRTLFYKDSDRDGYGNSNISVLACMAPAGHVRDNRDCDDSNKDIHPETTEVCGNNKDDNCNEKTDERGCFLMERVSRGAGGVRGNENSGSYSFPTLSADGRFVAFESKASNLVPNDTNDKIDIFVYDRLAGATERVSVGPGGVEGNRSSHDPSISADGRFVAFDSEASNLVPGDTNSTGDVFVRDRQNGTTERASINSENIEGDRRSGSPFISANGRFVALLSYAFNFADQGVYGASQVFVRDRQNRRIEIVSVGSPAGSIEEGEFDSCNPSISADGRFVAFDSDSSNLVSRDTNDKMDVFTHDRQTGETQRMSVSIGGVEGNEDSGGCNFPSLSADGHFVVFSSNASNLVPNDANGKSDIFVRNRQTGEITRVSVGLEGVEGNGGSWLPSISADGRFVAFSSEASNLVTGDTNGYPDIFVHDRQSGATKRVNISLEWGETGHVRSDFPSISADGRFVAFVSEASNLVPGDTYTGRTDIFVVGLEYFFGPLP